MDTKEIAMRWLSENLNYVDSVTVIDSTGRIIAKQRFNPRYTDEENLAHNQWALGKNLLELFPSLSPEDSTLLQVLHTGKIIYIENQEAWNLQGRKTVCNNLNFPIIFRGKIVGAVEISRDITHIDNRIHPVPPSQTPPAPRSAAARYSLTDIITQNSGMLRLKETIGKVANSTSSVLICGETGTGKEVFAQAIHQAGPRAREAFVAVNCSAFSKELLESELFGHRAGSFTGATKDKKGLFEEADKGTLFLDEIGEMPVELQAKLLRVLESGEFIKIGETRPTKVDLRIIAATNRDLEKEIAAGNFREDLYFRLSVFRIQLPALSQQREDVAEYARYFVGQFAAKMGKRIETIDDAYIAALERHTWHGNVRELRNVVERSLIMADGERLSADTLSPEFRAGAGAPPDSLALDALERHHILKVLEYAKGNKTEAARLLGIGIATLYRKLESYGVK